jgi:hypothetical protein
MHRNLIMASAVVAHAADPISVVSDIRALLSSLPAPATLSPASNAARLAILEWLAATESAADIACTEFIDLDLSDDPTHLDDTSAMARSFVAVA